MAGELIPMDSLDLSAPNTFVAFDLHDGRQIVGTFDQWTVIRYPEPVEIEGLGVVDSEEAISITEAASRKRIILPRRRLKTGYWAPMGYRSEVPWAKDR